MAEDGFIYYRDRSQITLNKDIENRSFVVDNRKGNNGQLRLDLDNRDIAVGTLWQLNVIYGFNNMERGRPSSHIVVYGANDSDITCIANIADGQTIFSADLPQDDGFEMKYGNLQSRRIGDDKVIQAYGGTLRKLYINSITSESEVSEKPNKQGEALGAPAITNFGVTGTNTTIRYLGVLSDPSLGTRKPTYLINVYNTYYTYKNE